MQKLGVDWSNAVTGMRKPPGDDVAARSKENMVIDASLGPMKLSKELRNFIWKYCDSRVVFYALRFYAVAGRTMSREDQVHHVWNGPYGTWSGRGTMEWP